MEPYNFGSDTIADAEKVPWCQTLELNISCRSSPKFLPQNNPRVELLLFPLDKYSLEKLSQLPKVTQAVWILNYPFQP